MIVHDVSKEESKSFSKQRIQVFQPTQLLSISKVAAMVTGLSVTWEMCTKCRLKSRGGDIWRGVIDVVHDLSLCHYHKEMLSAEIWSNDQKGRSLRALQSSCNGYPGTVLSDGFWYAHVIFPGCLKIPLKWKLTRYSYTHKHRSRISEMALGCTRLKSLVPTALISEIWDPQNGFSQRCDTKLELVSCTY